MYVLSELQQRYREKLVTPEQAAAVVKSGDRVHYGLFGASSAIWTAPWPSGPES